MFRAAGLCLLATMTTISFYGFAAELSFYTFYGAAIGDDCKEPCKDDNELTFTECDDLLAMVGMCEKDRCMFNKFLYLTCTPKDKAGTDAKKCEYHNKADEPRRWITVRNMVGCPDGGEHTYPYGECADSGGFSEVWTPCKTAACAGTIYDGIENQVQKKNRTFCGAAP